MPNVLSRFANRFIFEVTRSMSATHWPNDSVASRIGEMIHSGSMNLQGGVVGHVSLGAQMVVTWLWIGMVVATWKVEL